MVTLRCTRKLLRRLKVPPSTTTQPATTALGDWYANLLFTRPQQLILCVSERSLLSAIIHARDRATLPDRFRGTVREVLRKIGVPSNAVDHEEREMLEFAYGPTASKKVLGSINDFTHQLDWRLSSKPQLSLVELSLELSDVPCGPLGMKYPREAALDLLG